MVALSCMVEIFTSVLKTISGRPSEELAVHGERFRSFEVPKLSTWHFHLDAGQSYRVSYNVLNFLLSE